MKKKSKELRKPTEVYYPHYFLLELDITVCKDNQNLYIKDLALANVPKFSVLSQAKPRYLSVYES